MISEKRSGFQGAHPPPLAYPESYPKYFHST